jgi:hypothetical protein
VIEKRLDAAPLHFPPLLGEPRSSERRGETR